MKKLLKSNNNKLWTVRPKRLPVPMKLLRELRDAGFPQDLEGNYRNGVFVPTCDDVQKYLGKKLGAIYREGNLWVAAGPEAHGKATWWEYRGKTPLEALIRFAIKV